MERTQFERCKEDKPKQAKTISTKMIWKKTKNDKIAKKATDEFQNILQRLTIELMGTSNRTDFGSITFCFYSVYALKLTKRCILLKLWNTIRYSKIRRDCRHSSLLLQFKYQITSINLSQSKMAVPMLLISINNFIAARCLYFVIVLLFGHHVALHSCGLYGHMMWRTS